MDIDKDAEMEVGKEVGKGTSIAIEDGAGINRAASTNTGPHRLPHKPHTLAHTHTHTHKLTHRHTQAHARTHAHSLTHRHTHAHTALQQSKIHAVHATRTLAVTLRRARCDISSSTTPSCPCLAAHNTGVSPLCKGCGHKKARGVASSGLSWVVNPRHTRPDTHTYTHPYTQTLAHTCTHRHLHTPS